MAAATAALPVPRGRLFVDTSDLDIDPATRIISLSDIHGDIDALIIALRDCAKVIKSKNNIPEHTIKGNNKRDMDMIYFSWVKIIKLILVI